ncbi:MAG: single-stranded DNA-binding protein [Helicobacteraceae bacterium]|nr:single-stranded DNA-binding protein [Helicobacteraceae bacterium]
MLNKVLLIGNLTRDVEIRYAQDLAIAKFGIAVNRRWKDKEETMFIDVDVFGRGAEIAHQYTHKGSKVLVEGRLVLDQWTDQSGQKRSKHKIAADNIQLLDSKSDSANSAAEQDRGAYRNEQQPQRSEAANAPERKAEPKASQADVEDDEIPF